MFYLFLADGFEEVEALATLDVLRRAKIDILTVGVTGKTVTGSHGIPVVSDKSIDEVAPADALDGVILPGGMPGTKYLNASKQVHAFLDAAEARGSWICAICAAPMILGQRGMLQGRQAVCFPGFEPELRGAAVPELYVCRDGNYITAKGMGSAIQFGLAIVAAVKGPQAAAALEATLQCA
ncbi:MAG: DJ-1/PfpI family protein [Clostridia bacterium]|nr:DJ-1/PfpI family protein [Clostridia bacterium]